MTSLADLCACQIQPTSIQKPMTNNVQQRSYAQCCQPLHQGISIATNAEQLMRARYSAFVYGLVDYIVRTTLPVQQPLLDQMSTKSWSEKTDWHGLDIIEYRTQLKNSRNGEKHAQVVFRAYYAVDKPNSTDGLTNEAEKADLKNTRQPTIAYHEECSTFVYVQVKAPEERGQWYFLDPTAPMQPLGITQKQPCICGSREKFKRCCGPYI